MYCSWSISQKYQLNVVSMLIESHFRGTRLRQCEFLRSFQINRELYIPSKAPNCLARLCPNGWGSVCQSFGTMLNEGGGVWVLEMVVAMVTDAGGTDGKNSCSFGSCVHSLGLLQSIPHHLIFNPIWVNLLVSRGLWKKHLYTKIYTN